MSSKSGSSVGVSSSTGVNGGNDRLNFALPILNPPESFGIVESGVFRSNAFGISSFPYVQSLGLNTVVYVGENHISRSLLSFFEDNQISLIHLGRRMSRPTSDWKPIAEGLTKEAIETILDKKTHPIMVMCSTGIHVTGTIIGCLRRLQNWSLTSIIDEYRNHASNIRSKFENEQFIELFDIDLVNLPSYLPDWFLTYKALTDEEISIMISSSNPGNNKLILNDNTLEWQNNESSKEDCDNSIAAYKKYYFLPGGPLVSENVRFSEKKSIVSDDYDD